MLSGKKAAEFVGEIQEEASSTGMPESFVAVKNLIAKAVTTPQQPIAESENNEGIVNISAYSRRALEKRREEMRIRLKRNSPRKPGEKSIGEELSELAIWDTRLIPLSDTEVDPNFANVRLHEDPLHPEWSANEGQHLSDLQQSMEEEGLKIPIVVEMVVGKGRTIYLVRAGHRRRKAAINLGWEKIPAVVLPECVPLEMQHWLNILENTARKTLTTYELAFAAQRMRNQFHVSASTFAKKTGFSPGYVSNLLGCIDRLPEYLIEQWRDGARIALDQWISLSYLDQEQAIRMFHKFVGITPRDRMRDAEKHGRRKPLPPPKWLDRMQRLYIGIEGSELPPRVRDLCLRVVEICQGQVDDIPGVYEPKRHKKYEAKARLRAELRMPDVPVPGEEKEMPPPSFTEDGAPVIPSLGQETNERGTVRPNFMTKMLTEKKGNRF